ncbi:2-oxo acid dehydrogenase subunit E2 [Actinomadura pelletieri]|uniref:2-oxo acid dehydrogenase subunit E2 n=1 Tax=Actinomadura pelletieri TaxID=111805 RepID=UPI000EB471AF
MTSLLRRRSAVNRPSRSIPLDALSLVPSADHRVIDGALAARGMATLVSVIESPLRLLV